MHFHQWKRRQVLTLLGGAAVAPMAARAQQRERMRLVGVLANLAADDPEASSRLAAFVQGLQQLGWTVGRNLEIEIRWGAGEVERYRRYAAELVALKPDVILAGGGSVGPVQQVTRDVPIIFAAVFDPVGAGFVAKIGRASCRETVGTRVEAL